MHVKYNPIVLFIIFLALLVSYSSGFSMSKDPNNTTESAKVEGSRIAPKLKTADKVTWQKPKKEKDTTIYSGSAQADFGTFNFKWSVNPRGTAQLTTLESSGSGELPPREKKVFTQIRNDGATRLFHEWYPLANEKKPVTLRFIVDVKTTELFSAFTDLKLPEEEDSSSDQKILPVKWDKIFKQNDVHYLPGSIASSHGRLNIFWKKKINQNPELLIAGKDGSGKVLPETRLYFWPDESSNTSTIFLEQQLEFKNGNIPYLSYLATVRTDEILSGFKSVL
ncbi:MAG: hypothetical protein JXN64_10885 [Spirochaetes bacterium]|nr:hypothetical protein [Spirochaetota bacterium]